MTTNRLPYETLAGNLSSAETYKQLLENLRLAIEVAQSLSNLCKGRNDLQRSKAWRGFAESFTRIEAIIVILATNRASTGVGYHG